MFSQGSYYIPQLTLVSWGGQPGFLLYTPADWFIGVISQGSYCTSKLTLAHWGGQPGFLLYTPANSGLMGWSARVSNEYPSQLWLIGVQVSQGSYCIPQLTLIHWSGQSGFLLYTLTCSLL